MTQHRPTPLNRLLTELSWCLADAKQFRDGGIKDENVLTVHVLQALDLLPRGDFLGAVLRAAEGNASQILERAATEAEQADLTVLPNDPFFRAGSGSGAHYPRVQPDAIIESPTVYAWVEAKRANGGSFQPDQLAREYYCVTKAANGRQPLLLLLIGDPPPLSIKSHGLLMPEDAVVAGLPELCGRYSVHPEALDSLTASISERVAWITWEWLVEVLEDRLRSLGPLPPSLLASLRRIVCSATGAVHAQSQGAPTAWPNTALQGTEGQA
jgi:hypothetical protein